MEGGAKQMRLGMLSLLGDCNLELKAYQEMSEHPLIS